MSKNGMSDFIKEAIREKATKDLQALEHRAHAFGGIELARDALFKVGNDLPAAALAVMAVTTDAAALSKLKKLRKLVDDAHVLATEVADALGTGTQRDSLESSKQAILEALKSAGIDPASLQTVEDPKTAPQS
jgi:hypothetical protein